MTIRHRRRVKGSVQTLNYTDPTTGKEIEVGVFAQGQYSFTLDRNQTIKVLAGVMVVNNSIHLAGEKFKFSAGTKVVIKCRFPCAYICFYE